MPSRKRKRPRRPRAAVPAHCAALAEEGAFGTAVQPGKRALARPHRPLVQGKVACSLDIDTWGEAGFPNDPRWDYMLVAGSGTGHGAEVHPANLRETDVLIAKKRWAVTRLGERAATVGITGWHWLVPPEASFFFPPTTAEARRLAQAGIHLPKRRLDLD